MRKLRINFRVAANAAENGKNYSSIVYAYLAIGLSLLGIGKINEWGKSSESFEKCLFSKLFVEGGT